MELILNDITNGESMAPYDQDFEEYKNMACLLLSRKQRHLYAEDLLRPCRKGMTIDRLCVQEQDRFERGGYRRKNGKLEPTWFDLWGMDEINREDDLFDFFFACKLRHLTLLEISGFLAFHLDYSFSNNKAAYCTFLTLVLRQRTKLLSPDVTDTVNELIKQANEAPKPDEKTERIKGRKLREAGDHLTALNLNQTALLVQLMQKAGMILKGDYLTYSHAGKAFGILTGYSEDSIRQRLGTRGDIEGVKHEDYVELHQAIVQLADLAKPKK